MAQKKKPKSSPKKNIREIKIHLDFRSLMQRSLLLLIIGALFVPYLFDSFGSADDDLISIAQMITDARDGSLDKILVVNDELQLTYADGSTKRALKEPGQDTLSILDSAAVDLVSVGLEVEQASVWSVVGQWVFNLLPIALFIGFFVYITRQARGGQGGIMGIGKSKAKLFIKGKQDTKFDDVGGMTEAKKELEEIVDFLKNPKKYQKVGARTPKGVLLVGPAGTGKTLLARAVAGEAKVQFLSIAGSEFMEMLVGVGASRVRDLFETAKKLSPSIIFIDEIDAIGRMRGQGSFGGHDEREQTLNQILVEMDGFAQNDNVIVMAATNRGDMLDPALVRPGRFDRRVSVNLPDLEERKFILTIHAKDKPIAKDLDWDKVAKRTVGFSGADIENMLNEAAIAVARSKRSEILMSDVEEASLKVKLGPSKKRLHDENERAMTAYHEAGHAVIAHVSEHADPVHRVSIISRGQALGFTLTPPEKDKLQTTKSELIDRIAVLLGGRTAEELVFGEMTAGARSDIQQATRIARAMVVEYGMSELGPMQFSPQYEMSYAALYGEAQKISDKLQEKVDAAMQQLIAQGQKRALALLKKYRTQLEAVSQKLLEVETLDDIEFETLMGMPKAKEPAAAIVKAA